ncbi:MAG: AAA family ATPase [Patescibacteria group bacterium]
MFDTKQDFFKNPSYRFHRAVALEHTFSKNVRKWVSIILDIVVVFSLVSLALNKAEELYPRTWNTIDPNIALGLLFTALSLWLFIKMLNYYFNSYYFYVEGLLERGKTGAQTPFTTQNYEVSDIYYLTKNGDLLKSFATSRYGEQILMRIGMKVEDVKRFLSSRTNVIRYDGRAEGLSNVFTLLNLASFLVENDAEFLQFLFEHNVRKEEFLGGTEWIERIVKEQKMKEHTWGRIALGKITPVGSDFAYGGAYLLSSYSEDFSRLVEGGSVNFQFVYGSDEIKQLQTILSRGKEANAILVGEEGVGIREVILDFARDITNDYTNPALKHKRVLSLNTKVLLATMPTKQDLEVTMLKIMDDAISAGNIILVVEDLPQFIHGCGLIGSDVMLLIDPYLAGEYIQFIATANTPEFHQAIEPNGAIMKRFEKIILREPGEKPLIRMIERIAEDHERQYPIFFTYPAIVEIIHSAQNYFDNAIMPDKAVDLLTEITSSMVNRREYVVSKKNVLDFVSTKTSIPLGVIGEDEREKLENLESYMKDLVVGQEEAIVVIANAMRRSRAGVRNPNRPIGSFLFLGPTGVGKTETAKTLAKVYFGNESAMSRLDMSEYQGEDGLGRLIGANNEAGALSLLLKTEPYGVFLLDEFEKANPKVLDIFLQLLDEGVVHNADGKKINGRNSIFIATSNAGANEIREAMKSGINLEDAKKGIIDTIIASGNLRPELVNRFDGIILFHPLSDDNYRKIAVLMLNKLKKRMYEKNINLVINDALIGVVMKHGIDPDFGARPMARAIQDTIEQKIANKIIAGNLGAGSTIEFSKEDFA